MEKGRQKNRKLPMFFILEHNYHNNNNNNSRSRSSRNRLGSSRSEASRSVCLGTAATHYELAVEVSKIKTNNIQDTYRIVECFFAFWLRFGAFCVARKEAARR